MVTGRGQKEAKGRKETKGQKTRKYRGGQRKKAGQRGVLDVDWLTGKEVGEGRTATKAARYLEDASRQKKAKYRTEGLEEKKPKWEGNPTRGQNPEAGRSKKEKKKNK